jgi:hypothetical protein
MTYLHEWTILSDDADTVIAGYIWFISLLQNGHKLDPVIDCRPLLWLYDLYHVVSNCVPFRSTWVHPRILVEFVLLDL